MVSAATGLVVDSPDVGRPATSHLAYVLDADSGRAHWVSADVEPAAWTGGYVREHTGDGLPPGYARSEVWTGRAPAIDAEGLRVEVTERTRDAVTIRVSPGRDASRLSLRLDAPVTKVTATAADADPVTVDVEGSHTHTWPAEIRFRDLPADGVEFTVHTRASRLTAIEETRGLADVPGFRARPPELTASPRDDVDLLSVTRTYELDR